MVTHEPSVAAYAQEVAVMKDGRIVNQFSTTEARNTQDVALRYQEALRVG